MVNCKILEKTLKTRLGWRLRKADHGPHGCAFFIRNPRIYERYPDHPMQKHIDSWNEINILHPCEWGTGGKKNVCAHVPVHVDDAEKFVLAVNRTGCQVPYFYSNKISDTEDMKKVFHVECQPPYHSNLIGLISKWTGVKT